jgi:iron complex outermembrane receptor protein
MGFILAASTFTSVAWAQVRSFDLPPQEAVRAIPEFARQAKVAIIAPAESLEDVRTPAVKGNLEIHSALASLLGGTGLVVASEKAGAITLRRVAYSSPASVAGPAAAPAVAPVESGEAPLGEIIVTARKRSERLQDVPAAVTAYTPQDLGRYATQSFGQIAEQTPSLITGASGTATGAVLTLRGVGSPSTSTTIEEAVSVNIDGIPINSANSLRLGLLDLDRVEILKGPQALFFGKNSPAGVISVVSADPTQAFEAKARTGYEVYNERKYLEAIVSGPLSSTVGARLDAYFGNQNGWFRNDAAPVPSVVVPAALGGGVTEAGPGTNETTGPKNHQAFVRGTLTFTPENNLFDAKLKTSYFDEHVDNGLFFLNQLIACGGAGGVPWNQALLKVPGASTDCTLNRYANEANISPAMAATSPLYGDGQPSMDNQQFLTSLNVDFHPLDKLAVTSVTGFYSLESEYTTNYTNMSSGFWFTALNERFKQFTQEVRAVSSFDFPVNFMTGAFYEYGRITAANPFSTANPSTGLILGTGLGPELIGNNQIRQKTSAWSVFGQAIATITSQLEFTAGGRYSKERKDAGATVFPNVFNTDTYDPVLEVNQRTFTNFSPEFTLRYKPTDDLTVYGSYRTGFQSGGFDLSATTGTFLQRRVPDPTYGQEIAKGEEFGIKGLMLDHQLRFDLALFNFKYSGLQVSAFNPVALSYQVTNAGAARVDGTELSLAFAPRVITGLTLRSAVAFDHTRYITFSNAPCYAGQTQAEGCNLITSTDSEGNLVIGSAGPLDVGNAQNLGGRPLARAPTWSGNVGGSYEYGLPDEMTLGFTGDAIYSGRYNAMPEEDPRAEASSAVRFNSSVTLRGHEDRWELALIGANLTNVLRPVTAVSSALTGGGTGTLVGQPSDLVGSATDPRTVLLQFSIKY